MNFVKIFTLWIALILPLTMVGQPNYNHIGQKINTKAPKEVIVRLYNLEGDEPYMNFSDSTIMYKAIRNKNGLVIHQEQYNPTHHGYYYSYSDFQYDHKNRFILKTEFDKDGLNVALTEKWLYNDRKKFILRETYDIKGLFEYSRYIYNKNQKIDSLINYWPDGSIEFTMVNEYSKNKIKTIYPKTNGAIKEISITNFDRKGKKVEDVMYSEKNEFIQGHYYTYDKKGNLTQDKFIDDKKNIETEKYFYNKKKRLVKKITEDTNGIMVAKIEFEYNKEGDIILETRYNSEGKTTIKLVYEYRYN